MGDPRHDSHQQVTGRLTPRCSGRHSGARSNVLASGVDQRFLRLASRPVVAAELIVRWLATLRHLVLVLAFVALAGCRSEESRGASAPKTQEAVHSSGMVEASRLTPDGVAAPPAAESASSDSLESNVQPPVPVFRPDPDWSRFPTSQIPGPGGVYSADVDLSGNVLGVSVVRPGDPRVDELVLEALRDWRFEPATSDGRPVEATYRFTINIHFK